MRTPEEIKKGLNHCSNDAYLCYEGCPYFNPQSNGIDCASKMHADALAYIQQLEERNAAPYRQATLREVAEHLKRMGIDCCCGEDDHD